MLFKSAEGGDSGTVTSETRGQAIKRRRLEHGIRYVTELAEATGVNREAVTKAEKDDPTTSEGTYQRLEAWLDAFDQRTGHEDAPHIEQIEFTVEGDFGVKVTVKGPITDRAALEDSVTKIIRSIRGESAT